MVRPTHLSQTETLEKLAQGAELLMQGQDLSPAGLDATSVPRTLTLHLSG